MPGRGSWPLRPAEQEPLLHLPPNWCAETLTRVYRVGTRQVHGLQGITLVVDPGRVVEREGTTVLMATHDLTVDLFADRVHHLEDGCIVE